VISEEDVARPGYAYVDSNVKKPLLSSRTITRDGQMYTTAYSSFDAYGNPQAITETGNKTRTTNPITYFPPSSKWIIGLKKDETLQGIGTIQRTYNGANGNLTVINRYGVTTQYAYNADGSINLKTDPRNSQTTYSNYFRGIPQMESRPESVTISRVVDYFGNVTSETDGISTWGYGYDGLNRIVSVDFPTGTDSTIAWTNNSRTRTRGALVETHNIDGYSRPTSTVRANITTTYQHDPLSRRTFESYPDGGSNGVTQTLDLLGRVKTSANPAGTKTMTYAANSMTITNELNIPTTYAYDRYGEADAGYLTSVDISNVLSTAMTRNAIGLITNVTQGTRSRSYAYSNKFFMDSMTDPETGTTAFGRDANGNMISRSVGGVTTSYAYDGLDRMIQAIHTDSAGTVTSVYNKRGQLTSVTNSSGLREYDYDANGNMKLDKLTVGSDVFTTDYTYDGLDALATIKYPLNNRVVTFSPNALGRPTQVSPYISSATHFSSGNLNAMTYGNGVIMNFGENLRQMPTTISSSPLSLTYAYDVAGNVGSIANNLNGADSKTMCYDAADRLTSTSGCGTSTFQYDTSDNLTRNDLTTYFYDGNNRLSSTTGAISRTIATDSRGRVTSYSGKVFSFDDASQLKCVNCNAAGEIKYAYDGKGQRIWQEKGGNRTYFVQAPNGDLLFEYTPVGQVWKEHGYLHGKRVASRDGSNAPPLSPTTLSVSASPGSGTYGQTITFTASISAGTTGSMQFLDGAISLGTSSIAGNQATLAISNLSVASHTITAKYAGDAAFAPVDATVVVNISKATQTISFTTIPAKVATDVPFTVTATATSTLTTIVNSGTPNICTAGGVNGKTVTLAGNAGTCVLDARQDGDSNYFPATVVTQSFVVGQANPSITLVSSNPNQGVGQVVTLTATLSGASLQTGTISFTDNNAPLDSVGVQSGTTSYSYATNTLSVGTHSLRAAYSGDSNNAPITSTVVAQIITNSVSTTTCSASAATILNTANLTFAVSVTGSSPTGLVTIKENGVTLATATLNGGTASAVFKLQSPGPHTITATYDGDSSNGQSSCAAVSVQVKFDPALMLLLFPDAV